MTTTKKVLLCEVRRKRTLLTFVTSLFLFVNFAVAQDKPKITALETVFKFSEVSEGDKVEHTFQIRNDGTAPLAIQDVRPDCGCTVVKLEQKTLNPGETAEILASFDTSGFQGMKSKLVRIYSNDSDHSPLILKIEGKISAQLIVTPTQIYFGNIVAEKGPKKKLEVQVGEKYKILGVESSSPRIIVTSQNNEAGNKATIGVSLSPETEQGPFRGDVLVRTSMKDRPVIHVPVFAIIEGDIQVFPAEISLGLIEGPLTEPIEKTVKISSKENKLPVDIKVSSDSKFVEAILNAQPSGGTRTLDIRVLEGALGTIRAKVSLIFMDGDREITKTTIPVYAIIARRIL